MPERIKSTRIIYFALLGGMVLFGLMSIIPTKEFSYEIGNITFVLVAGLMLIGAILIGNVIYRKKIAEIVPHMGVEDKFKLFQTASLIRWASLEGATLLSLVFFQLDGSVYFLGFALLGIGVYLAYYPSNTLLKNNIKLNSREEKELFGNTLFQ